jgi:DNA polymerase-3 subunit epsilon
VSDTNSGLELRRGGTLVERALAALGAGPLHTTELAARVMGIRGGAAAAAAAVFTLLGTDPRFRVDAAGVWDLTVPRAGGTAATLHEEEWVVVDVETTGGSPHQGHRITEIAAVRVSGGEIRETYSTLVNPDRHIPRMITSLTGITNEMVRGAPRFHEVAHRVSEVLGGCVFVAHNAAFDWRFVNSEMQRATSHALSGRQLCTVRLARKLLPHLPSRGLDALAQYYGLEIEARHRALDDAVATAHVLLRFLDTLRDREVVDWTGMEVVLGKRAPRKKRQISPKSMESA